MSSLFSIETTVYFQTEYALSSNYNAIVTAVPTF